MYSLLVYGLSLKKALSLTLEMTLKILKDITYIYLLVLSRKRLKWKGRNIVSAAVNLCSSDIVLYLVEFNYSTNLSLLPIW